MKPAPVYEAHFADGSVGRMSFWSKYGQPFDFTRGRQLCESAWGKRTIAGFVEHDTPASPFVRLPDPMQETAPKLKRTTAKQYRDALTALVDQALPSTALDHARELIAA